MLECTCLLAERGSELLLVRVRDNERWYLPGGKIEAGETTEEALCRELAEELRLNFAPDDLRQRCVVEGPAYLEDGRVRLVCFSVDRDIAPEANGEVSDWAWMGEDDYFRFAPAVQKLYDHLRAGEL